MSNKSRLRPAPNPGWFPKGRSGNLKGRPTTARVPNGSAFEVLVEKTLTVANRGGTTREIPVEEALQQRTYQDALAGKRMAMREVVKWIIKREAWLTKHEPKARQPILFITNPDPDNADAALVLLGIAAHGTLGGGTSETLRDLIGKRIMDAADTGAELLAYDMTSGADLAV